MQKIKLFHLFVCGCLMVISNANAQAYDIWYTYPETKNSKFRENRKYGILDSNKNIILPAEYDEVSDFYKGFAKVVKNDKVGFVNSKAEEIIPCMYDRDTQMITGAVIFYVMDRNMQTESIVVTTDERREGFNEDLVCVIKNGKYGFISKNNTMVIPFQFDGADNFYDGIAIVKMKNKYGAIDKAGLIVIPVIYDLLVLQTGRKMYLTRKDGECFLMDKTEKKTGDCFD